VRFRGEGCKPKKEYQEFWESLVFLSFASKMAGKIWSELIVSWQRDS
jgi:hypothetical protein